MPYHIDRFPAPEPGEQPTIAATNTVLVMMIGIFSPGEKAIGVWSAMTSGSGMA